MAIGDFSLGRFAAGPYAGTVAFAPSVTPTADTSAYSIGLTQDGFMVGFAEMAELLNKTDRYGQALIETFHQGMRMSVNCIFHEWKHPELFMVTPNTAISANAASVWSNGTIGALGTDFAMSLNLTARVNTPAAWNGVASITFPLLKCRSNFDVGLLFGPEHRVIPFMADAFPYSEPAAFGGIAFASSG